jgi:LPXTG-site transpeptidase (sortase) family protein
VKATQTECADAAETGLGAPLVITGRGDRSRDVRVRATDPLTPTRVTLASVDIDAPVSPVGIDTQKGVLGVGPNIHRTGWWRDGMAPGARKGAILIAGHVDSAKGGAGAFFNLKDAQSGQRVEVTTAGGRTFAYKVVSVQTYLKSELPLSVYSQRGRARLVLVTCGGPFDHRTRHYRDNIVLTAVPV